MHATACRSPQVWGADHPHSLLGLQTSCSAWETPVRSPWVSSKALDVLRKARRHHSGACVVRSGGFCNSPSAVWSGPSFSPLSHLPSRLANAYLLLPQAAVVPPAATASVPGPRRQHHRYRPNIFPYDGPERSVRRSRTHNARTPPEGPNSGLLSLTEPLQAVESMFRRGNGLPEGRESHVDLDSAVQEAIQLILEAVEAEPNLRGPGLLHSPRWLPFNSNAWARAVANQAAMHALLCAMVKLVEKGEGRDRETPKALLRSLARMMAPLERELHQVLSLRRAAGPAWLWAFPHSRAVALFHSALLSDSDFRAVVDRQSDTGSASSNAGPGAVSSTSNMPLYAPPNKAGDGAVLALALKVVAAASNVDATNLACAEFSSVRVEERARIFSLLQSTQSMEALYVAATAAGLEGVCVREFGWRAALSDASAAERAFWVQLAVKGLCKAMEREGIKGSAATIADDALLRKVAPEDIAIFAFFAHLARSIRVSLQEQEADARSDEPFDELLSYMSGACALYIPGLESLASYQLFLDVAGEELSWLPLMPTVPIDASLEKEKNKKLRQLPRKRRQTSAEKQRQATSAISTAISLCRKWMSDFSLLSSIVKDQPGRPAALFLKDAERRLAECRTQSAMQIGGELAGRVVGTIRGLVWGSETDRLEKRRAALQTVEDELTFVEEQLKSVELAADQLQQLTRNKGDGSSLPGWGKTLFALKQSDASTAAAPIDPEAKATMARTSERLARAKERLAVARNKLQGELEKLEKQLDDTVAIAVEEAVEAVSASMAASAASEGLAARIEDGSRASTSIAEERRTLLDVLAGMPIFIWRQDVDGADEAGSLKARRTSNGAASASGLGDKASVVAVDTSASVLSDERLTDSQRLELEREVIQLMKDGLKRNEKDVEGAQDLTDRLSQLEEKIKRSRAELYAEDLSSINDEESAGAFKGYKELLKRTLDVVVESSQHYWQGTRLLAMDVAGAADLLKQGASGKTLSAREVKQLRRTLGDLATILPFGLLLLVPLTPAGHAVVLATIQRYAPWLMPSSFAEERLEVLRRLEQIKALRRQQQDQLQAQPARGEGNVAELTENSVLAGALIEGSKSAVSVLTSDICIEGTLIQSETLIGSALSAKEQAPSAMEAGDGRFEKDSLAEVGASATPATSTPVEKGLGGLDSLGSESIVLNEVVEDVLDGRGDVESFQQAGPSKVPAALSQSMRGEP